MALTTPLSITAIVPAAGVGSRMKADRPKQYLLLNGKTVLEHTIEQLLAFPLVNKVVVAITDGDPYFPELTLVHDNRVIRVSGGKERADSVLSGLSYVQEHQLSEWVMVHDAARPCIRHSDIDKLIAEVIPEHIGGILASPVRDTMKHATQAQCIETTIDRSVLWHALTPQLFTTELLYSALQTGLDKNLSITDESSAIELMGYQPKLVQGRADNLKITQPEDLDLAEFYLQKNEKGNQIMRIGHGFDVHKFGGEGPVIIGGVSVPYEQGLIAHSDGDVALHALCDALLGAIAEGDIGRHFPDTDDKWKGADSRALLRDVYRRVKEKGFVLGNADVTIIAQAPKMAPHIQAMCNAIAEDLETELDNVNVKATTSERLGFTGRKEGIACEAVVLLVKAS